MILTALGASFSETELAKVMGSYSFGTPASRVTRLETLGYDVQFGSLTVAELQTGLSVGMPAIVFVRADFLPWADFAGFHALVLVGLIEGEFVLLDPASDAQEKRLSLDGFLFAWEEFDNLAAIIWPLEAARGGS